MAEVASDDHASVPHGDLDGDDPTAFGALACAGGIAGHVDSVVSSLELVSPNGQSERHLKDVPGSHAALSRRHYAWNSLEANCLKWLS